MSVEGEDRAGAGRTIEANGADPRSEPVLRIEDLAVSFGPRGAREVDRERAVDGVSLSVHSGQALAVVGESGCGKSVTAMSVLGLVAPGVSRVDRGAIRYRTSDRLGWGEVELTGMDRGRMRRIRGGEIAMIFQEPMSSLNPVYTVGEQIAEAVRLHQGIGGDRARRRAIEAMEEVGIPDASRRIGSYPHEFSGGMRQRVMIAMALACGPRVLLADEPTTALDVTVQAQILDLLTSLRADRGMSVVLITHDLGVVAQNADVVCVMYAGRVVEYASVYELFSTPLHPYTRGLLASIPRLRDRRERLTTIDEIVGRRGVFGPAPGCEKDVRPWWPWHAARDAVGEVGGIVKGGSTDSVLAQVRPGHWVGVWRTAGALELCAQGPDLAFRDGPASRAGVFDAAGVDG